MNVLDLFSGIGGFSLGLERAGMRTVAFCEIEPFCRRVLAKHWPGVPCYDDVRSLTADKLRADGIAPDVICGGFPCQDISVAGRQAGLDGTRSGLWSEVARLIGELRPRYAIVENVPNLLAGPSEQPGGWFGTVLGDLAALGYDAEWHSIPACAVGAPHQRDRVWIVANPGRGRRGRADGREVQQPRRTETVGTSKTVADAGRDGHRPDNRSEKDRGSAPSDQSKEDQRERVRTIARGNGQTIPDADNAGCVKQWWGKPVRAKLVAAECAGWWSSEPAVGRVADGVPDRVDRLTALGNAVVPQITEIIGRAILESEAQP